MAEPLVVFGSGGHAKVVVEAVLARTPCRSITILDDETQRTGVKVLGIIVRGGREHLRGLAAASIALGIGNNHARSKISAWLTREGFSLESVIHPGALVGESVEVGAGAFVSAGAIAIAEARIGAGAIINTGASIDHDCDIGEAAHIGPGARLCGSVEIGARTLIGVGASVRPNIRITTDVIVGAGAVVVSHIRNAGTYVGNPARPM